MGGRFERKYFNIQKNLVETNVIVVVASWEKIRIIISLSFGDSLSYSSSSAAFSVSAYNDDDSRQKVVGHDFARYRVKVASERYED